MSDIPPTPTRSETTQPTRTCPRCAHDGIDTLYTAQVPGVWDVLHCNQCQYVWRTTEPPRRSDRSSYPDTFTMTIADIANAREVPTIAALHPQP